MLGWGEEEEEEKEKQNDKEEEKNINSFFGHKTVLSCLHLLSCSAKFYLNPNFAKCLILLGMVV